MGGGVLRASGFYGFHRVVEDVALRVWGFGILKVFEVSHGPELWEHIALNPKPTGYPKPYTLSPKPYIPEALHAKPHKVEILDAFGVRIAGASISAQGSAVFGYSKPQKVGSRIKDK